MRGRIIGAAATAAMLLSAFAISPVAAGIPAATLLVVDDDGMASTTDCGASDMAFSTIQAAVTAATPGGTVKVCPGTYTESVTVDKTLKLVGPHAGQSAKDCAARTDDATVTSSDLAGTFRLGAADILLSGFEVSGNGSGPGIYTSPNFSGYKVRHNIIADNTFGVYYHASGELASQLGKNCISDNNRSGSASGDGVYSDQGLRNAGIFDNGFEENDSAAVVLIGEGAGISSIRATKNSSFNDASFLVSISVRELRITANVVRDDRSGEPGSAVYIGFASRDVLIQDNYVRSGHSRGIYLDGESDAIVVQDNLIKRTGEGILNNSTAEGAALIRSNTVRNVDGDGIHMTAVTSRNFLTANRATGSGLVDCRDETTGSERQGVANKWVGSGPGRNIGQVSSPTNLCRPD